MAVPSILVAVMMVAVLEKHLVALAEAVPVYRWRGARARRRQYFPGTGGVAVACGKQRRSIVRFRTLSAIYFQFQRDILTGYRESMGARENEKMLFQARESFHAHRRQTAGPHLSLRI